MSTATQSDRSHRFSRLATAARGTAIKNRTKGDLYGQVLAQARAEVYEQCAELTAIMPEGEAAVEMMRRAQNWHVRTPPIMGFDAAGVQYVTARAYQFCAWQIDRRLPQVARSWDEG